MKSARKDQIIHLVTENRIVKANELAEKFQVSMETIRRDLEQLEKEQIEAYVRWGRVRELCFQLIRGRKTPSSFRITLRLAPGERERFLREAGYAVDAEQIGSFLLNLRFEKGELSCVSLASLNCFPPERSLEEAWDQWAQRFFREYKLAVSVL